MSNLMSTYPIIKIDDQRIAWVDNLKFLGIFAIYLGHLLGHLGRAAGYAYPFVFIYHVPLFFFVSGFFAFKDNNLTYMSYVIKKVKQLLIPYLFFSILSIIILTLMDNSSATDIKLMLKQMIFGIRNNLFASSLWFLPCLFIIEIGFEFLRRLLKNKYFILIVCTILFVIAERYLPHRPIVTPKWIFNIDSALYYIVYYAIGAVVFPFIRKTVEDFKNIPFIMKRLISLCITLFFIQTGGLFFGIDLMMRLTGGTYFLFTPIIQALIIIVTNIVVAIYLSNFKLMNRVGQETLFLCGNETIIKTLVPQTLSIFGLNLVLNKPLSSMIYALLLLYVAYYTVIPFEKRIYKKLFKI
jgi:fucose 4-O-acetylase-like acetyltransferase